MEHFSFAIAFYFPARPSEPRLVIRHGTVVSKVRFDLPISAMLAAQHGLAQFYPDSRTLE